MNYKYVHLLMDSMAAVAYVREQGGTKSRACNDIACQIWLWAHDRNIWLTASHFPGRLNQTADHESRNFEHENEWMLETSVFHGVLQKKSNLTPKLIHLHADPFVNFRSMYHTKQIHTHMLLRHLV